MMATLRVLLPSPRLLLSFLLLLTLSSAVVSSSSSTNNNHNNDETKRLYSTLPPTVFAPDGRLFGVERVAREAIMTSRKDNESGGEDNVNDDESYCTVLAIRCGGRRRRRQLCRQGHEEERRGEFALMVGIGPVSPSLYRDVELVYQHHQLPKQKQQQHLSDNCQEEQQQQHQLLTNNSKEDEEEQITKQKKMTPFYKPLQLPRTTTTTEQTSSSSILPISILSPTLITATGGVSSIDSSILLRRSIEVALSFYKLDNGGIEFFASHSLEGMVSASSSLTTSSTGVVPSTGTIMTTTTTGNSKDDNDTAVVPNTIMSAATTTAMRGGGASGVKIETLVRRIADMAQSSTQNLGGRYGRMLSSSLLAMGVQQQQQQQQQQQHQDYYPLQQQQEEQRQQQEKLEQGNDNDELCIWRVDPTGQFWKCEASAVGMGTMEVEAELLNLVRLWKKQQQQQQQNRRNVAKDGITISSNNNVESTFMTYDDDEMNQVSTTIEDVRSYLASLTEDEAVRIASDCLVNGLMKCKGVAAAHHTAAAPATSSSFQGGDSDNNNNEKSSDGQQGGGGRRLSLRDWMEYDLRRRMECVILRSCVDGSSNSNELANSKSSFEIVRR